MPASTPDTAPMARELESPDDAHQQDVHDEAEGGGQRPENNQGGFGRHAHRQAGDGQDGGQDAVHPDLFGMAGFLFRM
jgi:hypothetical protein